MRFGCCGCMISPQSDPIGAEILEELAEFGFDYIELSLRDIVDLDEPTFESLARRIRQSGISCEVCNNFFPSEIRLTGPDAEPARALEYARRAFDRASRLGARVIVFGSAGSKNVPPGYSHSLAWKQIVSSLEALGPMAIDHEIVIAIEPLNRKESNIVNLASEGLLLVREVNHPGVQLLVDYYHLTMENEDPEVLLAAGPAIRHLHFAEGEARKFPLDERPGYDEFFHCLRQIHYAGRCSIEAYTGNFSLEAGRALSKLRAAAERAGISLH